MAEITVFLCSHRHLCHSAALLPVVPAPDDRGALAQHEWAVGPAGHFQLPATGVSKPLKYPVSQKHRASPCSAFAGSVSSFLAYMVVCAWDSGKRDNSMCDLAKASSVDQGFRVLGCLFGSRLARAWPSWRLTAERSAAHTTSSAQTLIRRCLPGRLLSSWARLPALQPVETLCSIVDSIGSVGTICLGMCMSGACCLCCQLKHVDMVAASEKRQRRGVGAGISLCQSCQTDITPLF